MISAVKVVSVSQWEGKNALAERLFSRPYAVGIERLLGGPSLQMCNRSHNVEKGTGALAVEEW